MSREEADMRTWDMIGSNPASVQTEKDVNPWLENLCVSPLRFLFWLPYIRQGHDWNGGSCCLVKYAKNYVIEQSEKIQMAGLIHSTEMQNHNHILQITPFLHVSVTSSSITGLSMLELLKRIGADIWHVGKVVRICYCCKPQDLIPMCNFLSSCNRIHYDVWTYSNYC